MSDVVYMQQYSHLNSILYNQSNLLVTEQLQASSSQAKSHIYIG